MLALSWKILSFENRVASLRTEKPCTHVLIPKIFILLWATHLLAIWKIKPCYFLVYFSLLNELSHFIHETNTVHCRAFGKQEKETGSHIWDHPGTRPLVSCCPCLSVEWCFSAWWHLPFPFSCPCRTRKCFISNLRITYLLGGWFVLLL